MNAPSLATPPRLPRRPAPRMRAVRRVFIITLFLNAAVAATKAGYGWLSHSLSLGTDSLHSILDASANVLALLGLHWSATPADARHPYGRRKIEILAALGIGVLIVIGMFEFAVAAVTPCSGTRTRPSSATPPSSSSRRRWS
jgi:cation diffusion facilitator family transporter